jgi:lysozyme family protein
MIGNFAPCLSFTLREEGGFSANPRDPGGATMQGITLETLRHFTGQKSLGVSDLKAMSTNLRDQIYLEGYWNPICGEDLPLGFDLMVFDMAVNAGPATSAKLLQRVLHVEADGRIGPATRAAIDRYLWTDAEFYRNSPLVWPAPSRVQQLLHILCLQQNAYYMQLGLATFRKGWVSRTNRRYDAALAMTGI